MSGDPILRDNPHVEVSPEFLILKHLFAPISSDTFYASLDAMMLEFINALKAVSKRDREFIFEASKVARLKGAIKDPVLIAAHFLKWYEIKELLETYPVNKLLFFADICRKQAPMVIYHMDYNAPPANRILNSELKQAKYRDLLGGYGARKKHAVSEVLREKPLEWHEYQAIKYKESYKHLLRITHPIPPDERVSGIWRWLVGYKDAQVTDRIQAYLKLLSLESFEEALNIAIENRLPWEVIRSRAQGLPEKIDPELLKEAANKIMTSGDLVMQARTLLRYLAEDEYISLLERRKILAYQAIRAAFGIYKKYPKAANRLYELSKESVDELKKKIELLDRQELVFLIDYSGSMESIIQKVFSIAASFDPGEVYLFTNWSYDITIDNARLLSDYLLKASVRSLEDWNKLLRLEMGGTPLHEAIMELTILEGSKDKTLVVITDEQANGEYLYNSLKIAMRKWYGVVFFSMVPYSISGIETVENTVVVPGNNINSLIGASHVLQMVKKYGEFKDARKVLEEIEDAG